MKHCWFRCITLAGKPAFHAVVLAAAILLASLSPLRAAVGCTLNDPDRDVKRLFPKSTGYRTDFITIQEAGGETLYRAVQKELGDGFDPFYEAIDVPYTYYDVLQGKQIIGRIHGVNQKGTYGGLQLILATDLKGKILSFYYQKLSSPEAKKFTAKDFTGQFKGLALGDFEKKAGAFRDPSVNSHDDFRATVRGLKKNLILLKELKMGGETKSDTPPQEAP